MSVRMTNVQPSTMTAGHPVKKEKMPASGTNTGTNLLLTLPILAQMRGIQGWLEADGFGEADLQPMGTGDIEKFIDHWHRAVAEEVKQEHEVA